jgi:hypothetical protein
VATEEHELPKYRLKEDRKDKSIRQKKLKTSNTENNRGYLQALRKKAYKN